MVNGSVLRGVVVVLLWVGCGATATAEDGRDAWYMVPSYHQTGLAKADMKYSAPAGDVKFDSSFGDDTGPGLAAGYAFESAYRIDMEWQRHSNDLKVSGGSLVKTSLKANTFAVNVWRDFAPWHGLRAYVGVGVGGGTLELNDLDGNFALGQLGTGFQWYFRPHMAVDIGYRYQNGGSPQLTGNSQKLTTDYASHSAQVGFRYDFGGH